MTLLAAVHLGATLLQLPGEVRGQGVLVAVGDFHDVISLGQRGEESVDGETSSMMYESLTHTHTLPPPHTCLKE